MNSPAPRDPTDDSHKATASGRARRTRARALARRAALLTAAAVALAGAGLASPAPSEARFADPGAAAATLRTVAPDPLLYLGGVEAGDAHSIGWTADGELYAWGRNQEGQLGIGVLDPASVRGRITPERVHLPDGSEVIDACAGADATIALTSDHAVYAWGGPGWANNAAHPQRTTFFDGQADPVVKVEAGGYYYLARTRGGQVFSWGIANIRLGRPVQTGNDNAPPALVTAGGLHDPETVVTDISAGRFHGAAIADGRVIAWGTAAYGSAGGVEITGFHSTPVEVAAGHGATMIRTEDGAVYVAHGAVASRVPSLSGMTGIAASSPASTSGETAYFAWRDDTGAEPPALMAWGYNVTGQLGLGTSAPLHVPEPLPVALQEEDGAPLWVASGGGHTLYESTAGRYRAAGQNEQGQFGSGDRGTRAFFYLVPPQLRWP